MRHQITRGRVRDVGPACLDVSRVRTWRVWDRRSDRLRLRRCHGVPRADQPRAFVASRVPWSRLLPVTVGHHVVRLSAVLPLLLTLPQHEISNNRTRPCSGV